ncbi:phosphate starvation protein PhoH [Allostella sp. ATCC 35155]|nr:phosphate starvation protein PhoH [Stella sp. ATCC 35155]
MTDVPLAQPVHLEFPDNALLPSLYGEHDRNLARIEQALDVRIVSRGNQLVITGDPEAAAAARTALEALFQRLARGMTVEAGEVDAAVRLAREAASGGAPILWSEDLTIRTRKRPITPRSPTQASYVRALRSNSLVFGLGPAGTGKTYLAVACAVDRLIAGEVDRIILSRPAVEAGERLGFLPGDLREKVDPYLRPLYDALHDMLPGDQIAKRMASGEIEVAPLAFMRGRTLADAFVILDEAQNTTPGQMKMFLTRLGANARMAVTGDLSQIDLPTGTPSGLTDAIETLADVEGIGFVRFSDADVVRHPLVARIVRAYDARAGSAPLPVRRTGR